MERSDLCTLKNEADNDDSTRRLDQNDKIEADFKAEGSCHKKRTFQRSTTIEKCYQNGRGVAMNENEAANYCKIVLGKGVSNGFHNNGSRDTIL